jgi:NTE family protein
MLLKMKAVHTAKPRPYRKLCAGIAGDVTSAMLAAVLCCALPLASARTASAQDMSGAAAKGSAQGAAQGGTQKGATLPTLGQKQSSSGGKTPENTGAAKPAVAGETSASEEKLKLGPLSPSTAPKDLPKDRPVIGLAMGGGGALGLSEIGTLQWLEEHRIPVDVIAGTSMGSILAALYSTGHTPDDLKQLLTEERVNRVFRVESEYSNLSFRRREDARELPNAIGIGLKHGASLRNSILLDTGLNELLDKEFLNYNDQTDFNTLPIPFRCQATDLNKAQTVTFARGSLQDAVRASASIPGVFKPFELDGDEFVDGAILENLPTQDVKAMGADVVIAISLPLEPVGKGDLDSILGVLQRAFAVGIENNEARDRKLANILIMPDIKGFGANDYLKTDELAALGYKAAEAHKAELIKYQLSEPEWKAYLARRRSRERPAAGAILAVKVTAPRDDVRAYVNKEFQPLIGKPVDTGQIEKMLAEVRADGRYDVDYTVGYDGKKSNQPIILVAVADKRTGPPFLEVGANIQAQTGGVTRATVDSILLWQDLGGWGNGLRANIDLGFETNFAADYFYHVGEKGFFVSPHAGVLRQPYYIYSPGGFRLSERQYQSAGGGADAGWGNRHTLEVRAGWMYDDIHWRTTTGYDGQPDFNGGSQRLRARVVYDTQDRALVPRYGVRDVSEFGYLYYTPASPNAPYFTTQITAAHEVSPKNLLLLKAEGGTLFGRDVAQPFRFTLGGPLRLSSLSIDQLRGTDYFLITPAYLRRLAQLPAPLGQSIYFGAVYEAGQMRSPGAYTVLRQDISVGIVAETPLGVIAIAPAFGDAGYRKFTFSLGKLF